MFDSLNNLFDYQIHLIFITEDYNPEGVSRYKSAQPCHPLLQPQRESSAWLMERVWGQLLSKCKEKDAHDMASSREREEQI